MTLEVQRDRYDKMSFKNRATPGDYIPAVGTLSSTNSSFGIPGSPSIGGLARSKSFAGLLGPKRSPSSLGQDMAQKRSSWFGASVLGQNSNGGSTLSLNAKTKAVSRAKSPRPQRTLMMTSALCHGLREAISVTEEDIHSLKTGIENLSDNAQQSQGRTYDLEKQLKAAERYLKRLDYQLSAVEELAEGYNLQSRLREGVRAMGRAYVESPGKERDSALASVRSGFKECSEAMCAIEAQLEQSLGAFHVQMKGLQGFARLCPGDVFEITLRHGSQKWRTRGKIARDGNQTWDSEKVCFKGLLDEVLFIRAVELRSLGKQILLGNKFCETLDLFCAHPQMMTVNLNASGSLKLNLIITWDPMHGSAEEGGVVLRQQISNSSVAVSSQSPLRKRSSMASYTPSPLGTISSSIAAESVAALSLGSYGSEGTVSPDHDSGQSSASGNSSTLESQRSPKLPTSSQDSEENTVQSHAENHHIPLSKAASAGDVNFHATEEDDHVNITSNVHSSESCDSLDLIEVNEEKEEVYIYSQKDVIITKAEIASAPTHLSREGDGQGKEDLENNQNGEDEEPEVDYHGDFPRNVQLKDGKLTDETGNFVLGKKTPTLFESRVSTNASPTGAWWSQGFSVSSRTMDSGYGGSVNVKDRGLDLGKTLDFTEESETEDDDQKEDKPGRQEKEFESEESEESGTLFDMLRRMSNTIDDIQGQYPQLEGFEQNVAALLEFIKKRSSWKGSHSSVASLSVETALECFDFLDAEEDESLESRSRSHSPYKIHTPEPDYSPVNSGPTSLEIPGPGEIKTSSAVATGHDQLDLALFTHLKYSRRLLEDLGSFGPLKLKEKQALEKLQLQGRIFGKLLTLMEDVLRTGKRNGDGFLDDLLGLPHVKHLWSVATKGENALCVKSDELVRNLLPLCQEILHHYNTEFQSKVTRYFVEKCQDAAAFDEQSYVTMYQFRYYVRSKERSFHTRLETLSEELTVIELLQPCQPSQINRTLTRLPLFGPVPPKSVLLALCRILVQSGLDESQDSRVLVARYFKQIAKNDLHREKFVEKCIEGLECDAAKDRQAACEALALMYATEAVEQLAYVAQTDSSTQVRIQAQSALLALGSEGRAALQQMQLSSHGFQGLSVK